MVEAASAGARLACVVSCPGQRSVLGLDKAVRREGACDVVAIECLLPEALRDPVMTELAGPSPAAGVEAASGAAAPATRARPPESTSGSALRDEDGPLVVTGIRHVMAVLEEIENGLLEDVATVEAYACEGGCFGSPLLFEDHHVARRRWDRGRAALETAEDAGDRSGGPEVIASTGGGRRRPYAARPGIRLDPDMSKAIEKFGRLQTLTRSLPGSDCGACGAPTCAALAEDIVMERAEIELCPYRG
jgi:hypothetical protein